MFGSHGGHRRSAQAFTLVELLVVIGIIAILIAVLLPALNKARQQSMKVSCAANLRSNGQACLNYAALNKGRLPQQFGMGGGGWMWDLPIWTRDALVSAGASRKTMYCPVYPDQEKDGLWTFPAGVTPAPLPTSLCVAGYFWYLERIYVFTGSPAWPNCPAGQLGTGALMNNTTPSPFGTYCPAFRIYVDERSKLKKLLNRVSEKRAAELELSSDAILSSNMTGGPWSIQGGFTASDFPLHNTSHVGRDGNPLGANVLYLDGHVDWRPFDPKATTANSEIRQRYNSGNAYFWW